jgi:hypothetical protein
VSDVTPIRPDPGKPPGSGAFGLIWTAVQNHDTRTWQIEGRWPSGGLAVRFAARVQCSTVRAVDVAHVAAKLLDDYDEGASALLAAAYDDTEETDDDERP